VDEIELHEDAVGHALDAELLEVALEAANHDRREVALALDGHAAGEAHRVEDLEQRAEAVRVAVVGRRREEQTVVEARGEIADGGRDLAVDGVAASGSRGGDVGLVEDEQALGGPIAEKLQERLSVLGAPQERVRNDEAVVRRPRVDAESALPAAVGNEGAGHHLEVQAEAAAHLALPLEADGSRAADEDEVSLLPQDELLHHQAGLDRLPEPDVVGNEEVRARQLQRLHERRELVNHVLYAGAERGLEAGRVGRAHRVPAQGVEVGAEVIRRVETVRRAQATLLGFDGLRAQLEVPEHLEPPAGIVVVEADQHHSC